MSDSNNTLVEDTYVHFKSGSDVDSAVELPTNGPYAHSKDELPTQAWQPWVDPKDAPTAFEPTSLSVYAQHSRGLWQPTNGAESSIYIIMMSTRNNVNSLVWITNDTVSPLAHCATLKDAHKNLHALAQQHGNAEIVKDVNIGHHFKIVGEHKTRTIWVKEVGHARSLKLIDLDDVDGGMHDDWIGDCQVEVEEAPAEAVDSGSMTDASTLVSGDTSDE